MPAALAQAVDLDNPLEAAADGVVALDEEPGSDASIDARLREIYDAVEGLADVEVSVQSGVVVLRGVALSSSATDIAETLAERTEGVIAVDNRIRTDRDVASRLERLADNLRDKFYQLLALAPIVLVAGLILVAAWWASRGIGALAGRALTNASNPFLAELVGQVAAVAVFVGGIVLVLNLLDADAAVGSVLGGLGLIGLAIGFAVRDTLENYLASLLLSLRQPFGPGELVSIDGTEGRVSRLTSRATILIDPDGNHIRIPNAQVFKGKITNYDRNPLRRFEFTVGIDADASISTAREILGTALASTQGVVDDPAPMVVFDQFGDWANLLVCHGWVDQREVDFRLGRTAAMVSVKRALADAGIEMPAPAQSITLKRGATAGGPGPGTDGDDEEALSAAELRAKDPVMAISAEDDGEDLLSSAARTE